MISVITPSKDSLPIKLWIHAGELEPGAFDQIMNVAEHPGAFHHIAVMPDVHQGYGMPIGTIMATEGMVIPNAVGVDIGCGMIAIKFNIHNVSTEVLKQILGGSKDNKGGIRSAIPVGFSHHRKKAPDEAMPIFPGEICPIMEREYESARKQLGTLGGGNHFIELQEDSQGYLWLMIHSGSRNIGHQIATHYNKIAVALNEKWKTKVPKNHQLAFLPADSNAGRAYIIEMNYALDFATANREYMADRCVTIIQEVCPGTVGKIEAHIHHNFVRLEHHFGRNVWIHRKGAVYIPKDAIGIIPGSQGTSSYIVRGKGNADAFDSCSHGAGRQMSRKRAQAELDLDEQKGALDAKGILHSIRGKKDLDEAPSAYKDINGVMALQTDLVDIEHRLVPRAVVKG